MKERKNVYKIRKDKVEELKDGRTISSIAEKIGLSTSHLSLILSGSHTCPKNLAILLSILGRHLQVEEYKLQENLNYFFEKVER